MVVSAAIPAPAAAGVPRVVAVGADRDRLAAERRLGDPHGARAYRPHPRSPSVGLSTLVELHASLLAVMKPLARARSRAGTVLPEDAWSDNYPRNLLASRQAGGLWPASGRRAAGRAIRSWRPRRMMSSRTCFCSPRDGRRGASSPRPPATTVVASVSATGLGTAPRTQPGMGQPRQRDRRMTCSFCAAYAYTALARCGHRARPAVPRSLSSRRESPGSTRSPARSRTRTARAPRSKPGVRPASSKRRRALEQGDALDVMGLREHVDGTDPAQRPSGLRRVRPRWGQASSGCRRRRRCAWGRRR